MPITLFAVIHEAEEGGFWAEIPSIPGCYSQGETWEEVTANIKEAAECHLFDETSDGIQLADWVRQDHRLYTELTTQQSETIRSEVMRLTTAMLNGLEPTDRQLEKIAI